MIWTSPCALWYARNGEKENRTGSWCIVYFILFLSIRIYVEYEQCSRNGWRNRWAIRETLFGSWFFSLSTFCLVSQDYECKGKAEVWSLEVSRLSEMEKSIRGKCVKVVTNDFRMFQLWKNLFSKIFILLYCSTTLCKKYSTWDDK